MLIHIVVSGLVLLALVVWFYGLEAKGDRHTIFVVLVITLLVEALLAGPAAEVPVGVLRPRILQQDFRPPDAVIVAALAARLISARTQQMSRLAVWWTAFIAMYVTGVVVGLMQNIPAQEVLFQGKAAFYLVGGIVLASGADIDRLYRSVGKLGLVLAGLVPLALVIEAASIDVSISTPIQHLNRLGRLSNDTVTLLTLVGVVVLLTEATRPRRRLPYVAAGVVLTFAAIAGHQRASYLVVAVVTVFLVGLALGNTWRRRSSLTGIEVSLLGLGVFAMVALGFLATSSPGVIVAPVQDAFGGEAESRSAAARISLVDQAFEKIQDNPIIGSGVGTKVIRKAALSNKEVAAAAHNVLLDVAMRIGLVGLVLLLIAVSATVASGLHIWRRARDNPTAAIAMSGVVLVLGVMTKGMVEPAFDKFRLSLTLGIGAGLVMAAMRKFGDKGPDQSGDVRHPVVAEQP